MDLELLEDLWVDLLLLSDFVHEFLLEELPSLISGTLLPIICDDLLSSLAALLVGPEARQLLDLLDDVGPLF